MRHIYFNFIIILLPFCVSSQTIYTTDFEANTNTWAVVSTAACAWHYGDSTVQSGATLKFKANATKFLGVNAERCGGLTSSSVTSPDIDLSGKTQVQLDFKFFNGATIKWGTFSGKLILAYSTGGSKGTFTNFDTLTTTDDNNWTAYSSLLPAASLSNKFALRITYSGGSISGIDNVSLTSVIASVIGHDKPTNNAILYPNPASKEITLKFQGISLKGANVKLYTHAGAQVELLDYTITEEEILIAISSLAAGCYVVVVDNTDFTYREEIVVRPN